MTPCRSGLNFIVKAVAKLNGFMVLKKNTQTANDNDKYTDTWYMYIHIKYLVYSIDARGIQAWPFGPFCRAK